MENAQPTCSQKTCQLCGSKEMKLIVAGISKKTGKQYSAFWSCPTNPAHNQSYAGTKIETKMFEQATNDRNHLTERIERAQMINIAAVLSLRSKDEITPEWLVRKANMLNKSIVRAYINDELLPPPY